MFFHYANFLVWANHYQVAWQGSILCRCIGGNMHGLEGFAKWKSNGKSHLKAIILMSFLLIQNWIFVGYYLAIFCHLSILFFILWLFIVYVVQCVCLCLSDVFLCFLSFFLQRKNSKFIQAHCTCEWTSAITIGKKMKLGIFLFLKVQMHGFFVFWWEIGKLIA